VATALNDASQDRRSEVRRRPHETEWLDVALLRPGQEVVVVNLSSHGALLESRARMRPGMRAELQLASGETRRTLRTRVLRCVVSAIDPIRYQGAVLFDERLVIGRDEQGSG
jgi:hypothetical protein